MVGLPDWLRRAQVTHVEVFPARGGEVGRWPQWVAPELVKALATVGIEAPWRHQVEGASLAFEGRDVVVATGTGSGKSLAYLLPALTAVLDSPKARMLYLSPTKALAADQLRAIDALRLSGVRAAALDGDTLREQRDWIRQHANVILTNPDLLHHTLLPQHQKWSSLLRQVRFVVVDESHSYRGVFGAHVAHVLRRLRRLTAERPVFILASATSGEPAASASKLVGRPVKAVVEDSAPRGAATFALWEPPLLPGRAEVPALRHAEQEPSPAPAGRLSTPDCRSIPALPTALPDTALPDTALPDTALPDTALPDAAGCGAAGCGAAGCGAAGDPGPVAVRDGASLRDGAAGGIYAGGTPPARTIASGAGGTLADRVFPAGAMSAGATPDASPVHRSALRETGDPLADAADTTPVHRPTPRRAGNPPADTADASDAAPVRRSALRETGDLLADAVVRGVRTLAFVPSRRGAEVVASQAKRALDEVGPGLANQVAAYRAGYLPEERRALEQALTSGELTGLATTNALELGIDVSGLDVVLLSGYPGTRAAMWQRAGRAGRAGRDGLCVLIAKDDPLDTYLVHHPEALFHRPVEATVFDPGNPYVLVPHLCAAAAEKPLTVDDLELFGASRALVDQLVADGTLRSRPTGWYWTHSHRPEIDLRGTGGAPISVIEGSTGRLIGTAGAGAAHHQLHQGAVYTHQGSVYVVEHLDLEDAVAMVVADNPPHSTHARDVTSLDVVEVRSYVDAGPIGVFLGEVEVTSQVVSFQRRRLDTGEVLGTWPLDLPPRTLRTVAVWATFAESTLTGVSDVPGALHAAEHAAIGLLPLVASCDRWDIGGLSTARHPDTDAPTIFVYDGHPGGAGFAERAYDMARDWFAATRDTVEACGCERGCPGCVQSPKCGNGNNPLDKHGAVTVLSQLLTHLARPSKVDHSRLRAVTS